MNLSLFSKSALFLMLALFFQSSLDAQVLDRLKKKAIKDATERLERRGNKGVEQGLDTLEKKVFGNILKDEEVKPATTESTGNTTIINNYYNQQPSEQPATSTSHTENINVNVEGSIEAFGTLMTGLSENTMGKYESVYLFDQMVKVKIYSPDSGEKPIVIQQYMSDIANYLHGEDGQGMFITDYKNKSIILLDDKQKEAYSYSLGLAERFANMQGTTANIEYLKDTEGVKCTKTGQTKSILGYNCQLWMCENDSMQLKSWYADEVLFNTDKYNFGAISNIFNLNTGMKDLTGGAQGTVLEMEFYDKVLKETVYFEVIDFNDNTNFILNTSDYTFKNGNFQF